MPHPTDPNRPSQDRTDDAATDATERLFSYGTLRQERVQRETFGRLLAGTADALVGFTRRLLPIEDPAVVARSGKTHHPIVSRSDDPADQVPGTVFAITPAELAAADRYEVAAYERVRVVLASGIPAWVYIQREA
ncbi:MAG TPA: gamma-glutamylcyclotransferase family protein [Gemmatimonadales bacterium]|nr:gamma-glutamylcyclotransferase family protein [Gemmatimonadales bacterium]